MIADAARAVEAARPEVIVGIGGGSALDVAKAARLVAGQGESFERFCDGAVEVVAPHVDLVAVPTTSGTGSEVSGGAVVVDPVERRKRGVAHPLMRAQHALVDPLLTVGLPPEATAYTGVDALAQAIGGVIASNGSVLSAAIGLEACRHVAARSGARRSRRRRPRRAARAGAGQPDGRPGDEPLRLLRRPRAGALDRLDLRAAARADASASSWPRRWR